MSFVLAFDFEIAIRTYPFLSLKVRFRRSTRGKYNPDPIVYKTCTALVISYPTSPEVVTRSRHDENITQQEPIGHIFHS